MERGERWGLIGIRATLYFSGSVTSNKVLYTQKQRGKQFYCTSSDLNRFEHRLAKRRRSRRPFEALEARGRQQRQSTAGNADYLRADVGRDSRSEQDLVAFEGHATAANSVRIGVLVHTSTIEIFTSSTYWNWGRCIAGGRTSMLHGYRTKKSQVATVCTAGCHHRKKFSWRHATADTCDCNMLLNAPFEKIRPHQ